MIEAMAAGVPVVQPREGAFPEIVDATGGGVLYEPNTAVALAEALETLLRDPVRVRTLGQAGQAAVKEHFTVEGMADKMAAIYEAMCSVAV